MCNLRTLTSFGRSAPREYAIIFHSTLCIVVASSVFGWHVYVHYVLNWDVHLNAKSDGCTCCVTKWTTSRVIARQTAMSNSQATILTRWQHTRLTDTFMRFCNKPGHASTQHWTAPPELILESLVKKRQQAMAASSRKRCGASDHSSPNYQFQGMALK